MGWRPQGQGGLAGLDMARDVLFLPSFPRTRESRMMGMAVAALDSRLHGNDASKVSTRGRAGADPAPSRRRVEDAETVYQMRTFVPIFAKIIAKVDMVKSLNSLKTWRRPRRKRVLLCTNVYFGARNLRDFTYCRGWHG